MIAPPRPALPGSQGSPALFLHALNLPIPQCLRSWTWAVLHSRGAPLFCVMVSGHWTTCPDYRRGERPCPSAGLTFCSFYRHPRNAWGARGLWNPWATWKAWLHQRSQGRHRSPWHTRLARISWGDWLSWNYWVPRIHRKPGEWAVPLLSFSYEIHFLPPLWDQSRDLEAAKTVLTAIGQHKNKVPFPAPVTGGLSTQQPPLPPSWVFSAGSLNVISPLFCFRERRVLKE